jgi:hypothetical protein
MELDDDKIPEDFKKGKSAEEEADAGSQKARMLVWLVGGGFVLIGGLDLLVYFLKANHDHTDISILWCVWLSVPLLIGVWILAKTAALADRLEEWLEQ